jgi:hypothetical protein
MKRREFITKPHPYAAIGGHHLGITSSAPPVTRVRLDLAGDGALAYINKRMIGRVGLAKDTASLVAAEKLGPDALRRFDFKAFQATVGSLKRDVRIGPDRPTGSRRHWQHLLGRDPVPGSDRPGRANRQAHAGRAPGVCLRP